MRRRSRQIYRSIVWLGICTALACASACGKKGPPQPPEPRGPLPPLGASIRQIGSRAVVTFRLPPERGDKPSQKLIRAELIRVSYPPGVEPSDDPGAFRRRGELVGWRDEALRSGATIRIEDERLSELAESGADYAMRYAIRTRDRRGRSSPLVVAGQMRLVREVAAPGELFGEPTADGVRLTWRPASESEAHRYNLYRAAGEAALPRDPLNASPLDATEFLDTGVAPGETYTYVVRAALSDGPPWSESEDSPRLHIVAEDRFAPASPRGLVAVQEGLGVRLFWNPSAETDLLGYRLYRRFAEEPEFRRVGPDPIERPLYLDQEPPLGRTVVYRVAAIDRAVPPNESEPSAAVELQLLAEPGQVGEEPR